MEIFLNYGEDFLVFLCFYWLIILIFHMKIKIIGTPLSLKETDEKLPERFWGIGLALHPLQIKIQNRLCSEIEIKSIDIVVYDFSCDVFNRLPGKKHSLIEQNKKIKYDNLLSNENKNFSIKKFSSSTFKLYDFYTPEKQRIIFRIEAQNRYFFFDWDKYLFQSSISDNKIEKCLIEYFKIGKIKKQLFIKPFIILLLLSAIILTYIYGKCSKYFSADDNQNISISAVVKIDNLENADIPNSKEANLPKKSPAPQPRQDKEK